MCVFGGVLGAGFIASVKHQERLSAHDVLGVVRSPRALTRVSRLGGGGGGVGGSLPTDTPADTLVYAAPPTRTPVKPGGCRIDVYIHVYLCPTGLRAAASYSVHSWVTIATVRVNG